MTNKLRYTDSVIVSFDRDVLDDNNGILLVGRQRIGKPVEIINAFQGEEAKELWKKLTVKEENKHD